MFNKILMTSLAGSALLLSPFLANAQTDTEKTPTVVKTSAHEAKEQAMLSRVQKELPALKIKDVFYHPSTDLYELFSELVYTPTFTDAKLTYLLNNGEVIDIKNKDNLTKRDIFARDVKYREKEQAFLIKLKTQYPAFSQFIDATYLPTVDLYELRHTNPKVAHKTYTNENIDFIFNSGDLLDLKSQTNLTLINADKRIAPVLQDEAFKVLPLDTAIKMTYGKTGVRALAIFSDPRCPWCKKMDTDIMRNLKDVDVDIYYFMNPLNVAGHEDAPEIASKVLCSEDKVKAWKEWMLIGRKPQVDGTACMPIVQKHLDIAIAREYNSTPTILTDTGVLLPTTLSSHRFADFLKATEYANQPHLITK